MKQLTPTKVTTTARYGDSYYKPSTQEEEEVAVSCHPAGLKTKTLSQKSKLLPSGEMKKELTQTKGRQGTGVGRCDPASCPSELTGQT